MKIDFIRLLRYAIGGYLLIGGISQLDFFVLFMGLMITLMAIFNVGCFGGQCRPVNQKKGNQDGLASEEVTFEEIV